MGFKGEFKRSLGATSGIRVTYFEGHPSYAACSMPHTKANGSLTPPLPAWKALTSVGEFVENGIECATPFSPFFFLSW